MVSEILDADVGVVFSVTRGSRSVIAASTPQILFNLQGAQRFLRSFHDDPHRLLILQDFHLPTVAVRLNGNREIGGPLADVFHFYLDRRFEFGGGFARLFHCADPATGPGALVPTRGSEPQAVIPVDGGLHTCVR